MLLLPLCSFIYGSAIRLREILLSQIAFRRESEKIAGQFDFAINNMSHGMCMISAEMKILVSNKRFSEFLGLPPDRAIVNVRFGAVLRLAVKRGALPKDASHRLLRAFAVASGERSKLNAVRDRERERPRSWTLLGTSRLPAFSDSLRLVDRETNRCAVRRDFSMSMSG